LPKNQDGDIWVERTYDPGAMVTVGLADVRHLAVA
jgi:hypothetical protein